MLMHPTLDKLRELRLFGIAAAFEEQLQQPEAASLSFEDRLGLLVDREELDRTNRRLKYRLSRAKLRQQATIEDLDFKTPRGLDKRLLLSLASCRWIEEHRSILITGPTGVGKSYIACALAHKACRQDYSVLYRRCSALCRELEIARADGTYDKLLRRFSRLDVLVIDDFALLPIDDSQRRDLYEVLEDRCGRKGTIVSSQYPVDSWHELLGEPTLADAIIDRLVPGAQRIALEGETLRGRS